MADPRTWLDLFASQHSLGDAAREDLSRLLDEPTQSQPPFEDLGQIGIGGWGEVRRVRDSKLDRTIAKKALRPEIAANASAVARFLDEARVTAFLDHPGVVPVHELGRTPDGAWYFTMKEVRGQTLSAVLQAREDGDMEWPLIRTIEAFRRACEAVAYAHVRGVVHRDLKPGNIMLGEFGEAFVLDWGLARRRGVAAPVDAGVSLPPAPNVTGGRTLAGSLLGTPQYMSPEHASGMPERVDARSDVFALGCILFEILARKPALTGETLSELLSNAANAKVGRIDAEDAPPELASIALRALSRDPDARYATAEEMADDLGAWLGGAPVRAHRYSLRAAVGRFVRRNRAAVGVGAVAALLLALAGAAAFDRLAEERDRAVQAERGAEQALAASLGQRATTALAARLRPDADLLAAAALELAPEPSARGVLVALGGMPHPALEWDSVGLPGTAAMALSEDGSRAYVMSPRGLVWVVKREVGALPGQIGAMSGVWTGLEVTPEGLLMGGGDTAAMRIVDPDSFATRRTFGERGQNVRTAHLIDGGASIISVDGDDAVRIRSFATGDVEQTVDLRLGVNEDVRAPQIPDVEATPSLLFLGSTRGVVLAFSRASKLIVGILPGAPVGTEILRASPDGRWLAAAGGARRGLGVWEAPATASLPGAVGGIEVPAGQTRALAWSADSSLLALALEDGVVEIRKAPRWERVLSLRASSLQLADLAFQGATLTTADVSGRVRRWSLPPGGFSVARPRAFEGAPQVPSLAVLRLGMDVAGIDLRHLPSQLGDPLDARWVGRGTVAITRGTGGVRVLSDAGELVQTLAGEPGPTRALATSKEHIAAVGAFAGVSVWRTATGERLPQLLPGGDVRLLALDFSEDGQHLAAASADGAVYVFGLKGGAPKILEAPGSDAISIAFGPSGELAVGTRQGTTERWDVREGRRISATEGAGGKVTAVTWDPAHLLVSGTAGGLVRIEDADSELARFPVPFSIDSVVQQDVLGADGTLHLWSLDALDVGAAEARKAAEQWSGMRLDGNRLVEGG